MCLKLAARTDRLSALHCSYEGYDAIGGAAVILMNGRAACEGWRQEEGREGKATGEGVGEEERLRNEREDRKLR